MTRFAKYLTASVPRYTSYPTAPHFGSEIGPDEVGDWYRRLDRTEPISVYLHIPFCRQLCWYCGCNMKLASRYEPVASYVDALTTEIAHQARCLPARMRVAHIHFGGGTPTALSADDLSRLVDTLHRHFDVVDGAEIAIEADPRTLSRSVIARIGELGFNRASFGVQEFDERVQRAINRIQPPDMVEAAVDALRDAGVDRINFDLIYGLPFQTTESLCATVNRAGDMRPDRIALFGYAHVPWMARKQRLIQADALPGAGERLEQAGAAAAALVERGYEAIGLDHFALPGDPLAEAARTGTLRRNFQGYTTDGAETLIGIGASSIGRTPDGYMQNITESGAWARAVAGGRLPVAKGRALSVEDRARGHVIESLMCLSPVDLDGVTRQYALPADWCTHELGELHRFAAEGLVTMDPALAITAAGRPFVRVIAAVFDAYLRPSERRHSAAV